MATGATRATLTTGELDLLDLLSQSDNDECGAFVIFGGTVRLHNGGKTVKDLAYSAYEPLAAKTLHEIEQQAIAEHGLASCQIVHRMGDLQIGDVSVYVIARSVHRGEAFAGARFAIEAVKHKVAIWKHERYTDGTDVWVEGCSLCGTNDTEP